MKKYVVFLLLLVFIPSSVKGIVSTDEPNSNHPITIYFFHREGCSHCEEEQEWLEEFVKSSSYIQVEKYEVTENKQLVGKVRKKFGIKNKYVPLTVIGDEYFIGYNKDIQEKIKKQCQEDIVREDYVDVVSKVKQEADLRNYSMISVPMLGIVLGLISGFNPFFLWTFAFFIMTLGRKKESKNTGVLGSLFLLGSGVLAMLGMLLWYGIGTVFSIPVFYVFIAMIALGLGILKISSVVRKKSGKKRSRLLVIRQMDRLGSKDVSLPDFLILILLTLKNIFSYLFLLL